MGAAGSARPDGGVEAMGATIRALRGRLGLSQVALGARSGMHHNYLGALERGDVPNPGLETIERIARGLDVSIAELVEPFAAPPADPAPRIDVRRRRAAGAGGSRGAVALGRAIRLVRRQHELTQARLAEISGLHRGHLGSIEVGEKANPGIATIARVAHGLDGAGEGQRDAADAPLLPLLPLLAQTFTGELTVAELRAALAAPPSGPPGVHPLPPRGAGT